MSVVFVVCYHTSRRMYCTPETSRAEKMLERCNSCRYHIINPICVEGQYVPSFRNSRLSLTHPVSFCRTIPPSFPFCFPVLPPSTTNRSSWKNCDTTVCLCHCLKSASCPTQPSRTCSCKTEAPTSPPILHAPSRGQSLPQNLLLRLTFSVCSSFKPFCINSCTVLASASVLCSRNASLVLLFAYSRKLYAANC